MDDLVGAMVNDVRTHLSMEPELLLVENGSTDATGAIALQWCERLRAEGWKSEVIQLADADYGAAMRAGFEQASGDWVINFDIDYFSGAFVGSVVDETADIVIASKRAPDSTDNRSGLRRAGTYGFNLLLRSLLNSAVSDTHGIKAFRQNVLTDMLPTVESREDLFDTELVIRSERAGFTIREVPIVVEERRQARTPFLRRVPRTIVGIVKLRQSLNT